MNMIRPATPFDAHKVILFLKKAGLQVDDVKERIEHFFLIESPEEEVLACIGVEPVSEEAGILRSFCIHPSIEEEEMLTLFQHVFLTMKAWKMEIVYVLTNREQALPLFRLLGFSRTQSDILNTFRHQPYVQYIQQHEIPYVLMKSV